MKTPSLAEPASDTDTTSVAADDASSNPAARGEAHHHKSNSVAAHQSSVVHLRVRGRPHSLFVIARTHLTHVPSHVRQRSGLLELCPRYEPTLPHASSSSTSSPDAPCCPHGDNCRFVHGDMSKAHEFVPHVAANAHAAQRHPPGRPVRLRRPGRGSRVHVVDSSQLLVTRAVLPSSPHLLSMSTGSGNSAGGGGGGTLAHCAHFLTRGECHRGADCRFVHCLDASSDEQQPPPRPQHDEPSTPLEDPATGPQQSLSGGLVPPRLQLHGDHQAEQQHQTPSSSGQSPAAPRRTFPFQHDPYRATPRNSTPASAQSTPTGGTIATSGVLLSAFCPTIGSASLVGPPAQSPHE